MTNTISAPAREILERHTKIAWDIDGTLLGGANSAFFRDYIQTHREQEHHVVTFRVPATIEETFRELARNGISHTHIASLTHCPPHLWDAIASRAESADNADLHEALAWKGKVASGKQCTILVDDLAECVAPGCARYGVAFLDANDSRCTVARPKPVMLATLAPEDRLGVLRIERNGRGVFSDGTMLDMMLDPDPDVGKRVRANLLLYGQENSPELVGYLRKDGSAYCPGWRFGFATIEQYRRWFAPLAFRAALARRGAAVVLYVAPRASVRLGENMCAFEAEKAQAVHRWNPVELG